MIHDHMFKPNLDGSACVFLRNGLSCGAAQQFHAKWDDLPALRELITLALEDGPMTIEPQPTKHTCMNPDCVDGKVMVGCTIDGPLLTKNCPECNPSTPHAASAPQEKYIASQSAQKEFPKCREKG